LKRAVSLMPNEDARFAAANQPKSIDRFKVFAIGPSAIRGGVMPDLHHECLRVARVAVPEAASEFTFDRRYWLLARGVVLNLLGDS
jgi:hypothetical protein